MKKTSFWIISVIPHQVSKCCYSGTTGYYQVRLVSLTDFDNVLFLAIEKQMFNYNDQMSSYEKIIEEAIAQSEEMFTTR